MSILRGGCLCGDVRYEVDGPVDRVMICHCAMCRRSVGAQSVAWACARSETVRVTAGAPRWYDSSPRGRRGFCARCGASLFFADPSDPRELAVTVGTFDEPDALPPKGHVYVPSKLAWVRLEPGLEQHEAGSFSPRIDGP